MKTERTELIAGMTAFFAAVLVFYLIGASSVFRQKSDTYTLQARFNQTDGLNIGDEVRLAGIRIGQVLSHKLDEYYGVTVTFSVPNDIRLPADSGASVQSAGLIGGKYIELQPGGDEDILEPGGMIEFTQDSPDLMALLDKVISMAKADRKNRAK
ncbi:MAG: MCE family protein [Alphaproteobacteria bacterium]|nr:MCE family protein [Alphaproteobacteria bacterium]